MNNHQQTLAAPCLITKSADEMFSKPHLGGQKNFTPRPFGGQKTFNPPQMFRTPGHIKQPLPYWSRNLKCYVPQ